MKYTAPKSYDIQFHLSGTYTAPTVDPIQATFSEGSIDFTGQGQLKGYLIRDGIRKVGKVFVFYCPIAPVDYAEKELVAMVNTDAEGNWQVDNLNQYLLYDVTADVEGVNSKIFSRVQPGVV